VAQEQAYEKRKLQLKQKRLSQQLNMAEGGKIVPDGGPQLYVPGIIILPHLLVFSLFSYLSQISSYS
jgi:hypothetical protein